MSTFSHSFRFRSDFIFDGAVDLNWLLQNQQKAVDAARCFVFHGPKYHGIVTDENSEFTRHGLKDTASVVRDILLRAYGRRTNDSPFTLAIAGYGTGKSHLAVTIASLLQDPSSSVSAQILENITEADKNIANEIGLFFDKDTKPCIPIVINGIEPINLQEKIIPQFKKVLQAHSCNTSFLNDLKPRFKTAKSLLTVVPDNDDFYTKILPDTNYKDKESLLVALDEYEEAAYKITYDYFQSKNIPLTAIGEASLSEVFSMVVKQCCGDGKKFSSIVIIFDEFGKYMEFASSSPQIAGQGALQSLYEVVQNNSDHVQLIGFIQYALEAYAQRMPEQAKNEILRYMSRYQSARRIYLSINVETLLAHLISSSDANKRSCSNYYQGNELDAIKRYFPLSAHEALWQNKEKYQTVVEEGCAPLYPFTTWILYYLASAGKVLQGRSIFAIVEEAFNNKANVDCDQNCLIYPADLLALDNRESILENEFLSAEDFGQQSRMAHSYKSILERHAHTYSENEKRCLAAILIASKVKMVFTSKDDAAKGIMYLTGLSNAGAKNALEVLERENNDIIWDEAHLAYDIISDGVPRQEFIGIVESRALAKLDRSEASNIFLERIHNVENKLIDQQTPFASNPAHTISSSEFFFSSFTANLRTLPTLLHVQKDAWQKSIGTKEARGRIFYVYAPKECNLTTAITNARTSLNQVAQTNPKPPGNHLPFIIVLLHDELGDLALSLAKLATLDEFSPDEKIKYDSLILAEKEKVQSCIDELIRKFLLKRNIVTSIDKINVENRLQLVCRDIFESVYNKAIPIPYDGLDNPRYAKSCLQLATTLISKQCMWDDLQGRSAEEIRRAKTVLIDTWQSFNPNGVVRRLCGHPILSKLYTKWDKQIKENSQLSIFSAVSDIISPPYGANIYSALLVFSLFISARNDKLILIDISDKPFKLVQFSDLANLFINKSSYSLATLKPYLLMPPSENSSNEWDELIKDWEEEISYRKKIEYSEKAQKLSGTNTVPAELISRYQTLRAVLGDQKQALEEFEKKLDIALGFLEQGITNHKFKSTLRGTETLKRLKDSPKTWWDASDVECISRKMNEGIKTMNDQFGPWLRHQKNSLELDVSTQFHSDMKYVSTCLETLGLTQLLDTLQSHNTNEINRVTKERKISDAIKEVDTQFINKQIPSATYKDIINYLKVAKGYRNKLKTLLQNTSNHAQLSSIYGLVESKINTKQEYLDKVEEKFKFLKSTPPYTQNKIDEYRTALNSFFTKYYAGSELMDKVKEYAELTNLVNDQFKLLNNINLTKKDLYDLKRDLESKIQPDHKGWNLSSNLTNMLSSIEEQRIKECSEWIDNIKFSVSSLSEDNSLAIEELEKMKQIFSLHPAYITDDVISQKEVILNEINDELNLRLFDWMIAKYNELSPDLQLEFLNKIR